MVKDTIGDGDDAALRVVMAGQKELHQLAKLLPDDGQTFPTPLVERFKEILYPKSQKPHTSRRIARVLSGSAAPVLLNSSQVALLGPVHANTPLIASCCVEGDRCR
jgi:hypothetical protein